MLLEKYYTDKRLNIINSPTSLELRALVFDEMCAASFKKQRFLRMYSELHNTAPNIAETMLPGNPYLGMWPALPAEIGAMRQLCALLEIESSQDLTSDIPRARLDAKKDQVAPIIKDQLAPIIKDLQTLCQVQDPKQVRTPSHQSAEERGKAGNDFKTAIGQIVTAFSNTKLSTISLGQARKGRGRVDNPTYGITINMVKVENNKLRDTFTEAVIELIKPRAREGLEFLPDT